MPAAPPAARGAPRLGALVRSEALRAGSRRSIRWLTGLALAAVVAVGVIMWASSAPATRADLDAAAAQFLSEQQLAYEQCLSDPMIPAREREMACWQPSADDALANAVWALPRQPFTQEGMTGLLAFAGGLGVLVCVLVAASAGGADWGARTMGLLLGWEPRRLRVFSVRLAVAVALAAVVELVVVGVALAIGAWVGAVHGLDAGVVVSADAPLRAVDLAAARELAVRWLPVATLAAGGSFAVAMAARSTGWAIGASIGFVAIVESVVQGVWAWGSQWLVQTNIVAWLQGGVEWVVDRRAYEPLAEVVPGSIWISGGRALLTLATMAGVALVAAALLFRARDVD